MDYENLQQLNQPFFEAYTQAFQKTLASGWYILGNEVKQFEQKFAEYCQVPHCVGVANGLDALIIALKVLNLPAQSEVIVPANTYIATILAIMHNGLKPVLVEPDIHTYNIHPEKIAEKITPNTRAIMPVHLYGKMCAMDSIMALAKKHSLFVIEDAAQAHGASLHGKKAGAWGDMTGFSFYPTKNLGALGDAGAIAIHDQQLYEKVLTLRNYGSKIKYYNEVVGYNSRLDELQASFLYVKLAHLDKINAHKQTLAKLYVAHLKDDFIKPVVQEGYEDVYHIFNIRHPKRDALRTYLLEHNIKTEIHYPIPPHQQKAMEGVFAGEPYPISEEIHQTTLSLPCSFCHTPADIYQVIEILNKF